MEFRAAACRVEAFGLRFELPHCESEALMLIEPGNAAAQVLHQKPAKCPAARPTAEPDPERLPDSKRVWERRRAAADVVEDVYRRAPDEKLRKHAGNIAACSQTVILSDVLNRETGETSYKAESRKCRERHCPVCQSARQFKFKRHFEDALPEIQTRAKANAWLHLVVTVKNCPVTELRATLAAMNRSWRRLVQRKEFKIVRGWTRGTEVTKGESDPTTAHPHFHALLLVRSSYFKKHYIKHEKWLELWQDAARLNYTPDIWIERADAKGGIQEVVKLATYSTKPEEMDVSEDWFYEFHRQVSGLRFLATGGIVKDILREKEAERKRERIAKGEPAEEQEEADDIAQDGQDLEGDAIRKRVFGWKKPIKQYRLKKQEFQP